MQKVKVLISNKQNAVKIPSGIRLLIRRCCHAVLNYENFLEDAEVSVSFVDNSEIQTLNAEYRDKNAPTGKRRKSTYKPRCRAWSKLRING